MFVFFFNLCICVYYGEWPFYGHEDIRGRMDTTLSYLFPYLTNLFGHQPMTVPNVDTTNVYIYGISGIISTICCIGCFFIIVKALKKLFTCFLDF